MLTDSSIPLFPSGSRIERIILIARICPFFHFDSSPDLGMDEKRNLQQLNLIKSSQRKPLYHQNAELGFIGFRIYKI